MENAIKNRYEFVMLFDVENGNPNGDPIRILAFLLCGKAKGIISFGELCIEGFVCLDKDIVACFALFGKLHKVSYLPFKAHVCNDTEACFGVCSRLYLSELL